MLTETTADNAGANALNSAALAGDDGPSGFIYPHTYKDAVIHGYVDDALRDRVVNIGVSLKGAKTPAGVWKNFDLTIDDLIDMLAEHKEGAKDGRCLLQGDVIDGERKAQAMRSCSILMLDLDTGEDIDATIAKIKELGLFAILWSTHSHLKPSTSIKKDAVIRFIGEKREPTLDDVRHYLLEVKRYQPAVLVESALGPPQHDKDGLKLVITHTPMPKFRVLFVLEKPFVFADHLDNRTANDVWKKKYEAVSDALGAFHDRSCTDPSRLMYTPRHGKDATGFEIHVIPGHALDLDDLPASGTMNKLLSFANTDNVASAANGDEFKTPWLHSWLGKNAKAFLATEFFSAYGEPRKPRRNGPGHHYKCPNDDEHTDAGNPDDNGFYAVDAGDGDYVEGFIAKCMHDSCKEKDRAFFLDLVIAEHGLNESDLSQFVNESRIPEEAPPEPGSFVAQAEALKKEREASGQAGMYIDPAYKDADVIKAMDSTNEDYALVTMGSQVRIMQVPKTPSELPTFLSLEAWRGLLANERISVGNLDEGYKPKDVTALWMKYPKRRTFKCGVVFEPGRDVAGAYNLWRGLPVSGRPGSWRKLKRHIFNNVCNRDKRVYRWLMLWLAHLFQEPGEKMGSAIALKGAKGTGKSKLFDWIRAALKHHAIQVDNTEHIVNNFNAHTRTAILMVCEEAFWAGDQKAGNKLKSLITSDTHMLELKGVDAVQTKNYLCFAFISNENWIVPCSLPDEERRYCVIEVNPRRKHDIKYFKAIDKEMKAGGLEAMVHELMSVDPERLFPGEGWDALRNPPATSAQVAQAEEGFDVVDRFFFEGLNYGRWKPGRNSDFLELEIPRVKHAPDGKDKLPLPRYMSVEHLRDLCDEYCLRHGRKYPLTRNAFTERVRYWLLLEGKAEGAIPSAQGADEKVACYKIPGLEDIRAHHENKGLEFDPLVDDD